MFKPPTSRARGLLDFPCDTCLGVYSDTQKRLNQAGASEGIAVREAVSPYRQRMVFLDMLFLITGSTFAICAVLALNGALTIARAIYPITTKTPAALVVVCALAAFGCACGYFTWLCISGILAG
jgi:hypothetical protein